MKLCPNNHQNADDAKFCETCGTRIPEPAIASSSAPEQLDLQSPNNSEPDSQPTTVNLDSLTEEDVLDSDIVFRDDSPSDEDVASDADTNDDTFGDGDNADDVVGDIDDSDDSVDDDDDDDDSSVVVDDDDDDSGDDDSDLANNPLSPTYLTTSAPAVTTAVSEMNKWAQQWDVTTDPYIKGLNEAIQQNNDLGMWSSLDPTQLLPDMPDQTTIFHKIGRSLAILRNVLVFLPVAITWEAISKATDAYTKWFPAADPENLQTEKNFLDFWANGYGVLDNRFTLPHIGIIDFWIIIVIILISLISTALLARGESENEKLKHLFESERLSVALRIRKALHGKREASPESIATSLADALADLTQTTRDMAEVSSRLEASTNGVMALTPQIEKLNDHAGTFALQTSTAIAQAVQQLVSSVDALNGSVSTNITTAFQTAVSSLQEVGEEMKRHASSVEYGTKLLKDDIEAIRKGLRR